MKLVKRVMLVMVVLGVILSSAVAVNAAGPSVVPMNENAQSILAKLNDGLDINGKKVSVPQSYITAFENYCTNGNNAPIEEATKELVLNKISELEVVFEENSSDETFKDDIIHLDTLTSEIKTECAALISETVDYVDPSVNVSIGTARNGETSVIIEQVVGGKVEPLAEEPIKQTGNSVLASTVVSVAVIGVLAVAVLVASKKKLFG